MCFSHEFNRKLILDFIIVSDTWVYKHHKALASDGQYLYLHSSRGLFKLGSGYAGTIRAHIYLHKPDFYPDKRGWLGYAQVSKLFIIL